MFLLNSKQYLNNLIKSEKCSKVLWFLLEFWVKNVKNRKKVNVLRYKFKLF